MQCRIQVFVLPLFTLNMAVTGFDLIKSKEMAYNNPVVLGCIRHNDKFEGILPFLTFFEFTENDATNPKEFVNFFDERPISVYFVGYGDKIRSRGGSSLSVMGNTWTNKEKINVCFSDYAATKSFWKSVFFYNYTIGKRLPFVANILAELLVHLKKNKKITAFTQISVVAFCMGNALGVMVAKLVENHTLNATKTKIGRFFGMDPASVGFRFSKEWHVKKGVADYTELLHTASIIALGIQKEPADAEFVVNDGKVQPRCNIFNPFCSHAVAAEIFRSIILNDRIFVGEKQKERCVFGPFKENRCEGTYKINYLRPKPTPMKR